jgi:hypothetical protein
MLLVAGCSKDLDLIPRSNISDATFWKTPADFKLAASYLYPSLQGFNSYDNESDIAFSTPNAISNGTYQTTETDGNWNTPYTYIRHCNKIITKVEAQEDAGPEIKRYGGEARFFRAYNYWNLFRLYGGVQLITEVLDINSEELYASRNSRKETIDFILADLEEAAESLPEQNDLIGQDIGRITKGAALALKARIALFEGTWGKYRSDANADAYLDIAIEASNGVINSGQYTLFTGMGEQSYRYLFIEQGDDASECILDRRYQRDISSHDFTHVLQMGFYLPTKKLADMYLCSDGLPIDQSPLFQGYNATTSEFQNRDPRMTMTILIPGTIISQPLYLDPVESWPFFPQRNPNTGYTIYKFFSEDPYSNSLQGNGNSSSIDFHIIRYAEVLLIYAEATLERNGSISDADLDNSVNIIRQRVSMPPLTNAFITANGLDMKQEIRRERTIELALEGFRYDDLRRWKIAETELLQDIKGIKITGSNWTDPVIINDANKNPYADAAWQENTDADGFIICEKASARSFAPDKHYLRPLPTREIALNPNLEQNPGW